MAVARFASAAARCVICACLALFACDDAKNEGPSHPDGGAPEASKPPPPVDLASIGTRSLDSLRADELTAICEAEKQYSDTCTLAALRTTTSPEDCKASERACRERYGDAGYQPGCAGGAVRSPSTCAVTVDEYLDCVKSFQSALSCDKAGYAVATDACVAVTGKCPGFALLRIFGKPPPCTPEESEGKPPRDSDDVYGADGCRPPPARFVVLGDSIADCSGSPDVCAPVLIADYLHDNGAPDLVFETHAIAGAKVADLIGQAMAVSGGPGHVYVWSYAMGNDLANVYMGTTDVDSLIAGYSAMFDYFTDAKRFPDGATFLLNTQYNPYDECSVAGAKVYPAGVDALIMDVNRRLILDVAEARRDAVAVDQLPDFLGHGDNYDTHGCPYCGSDNTQWVSVLHPNAAGNRHMAEKWERALAAVTGPSCATGDR